MSAALPFRGASVRTGAGLLLGDGPGSTFSSTSMQRFLGGFFSFVFFLLLHQELLSERRLDAVAGAVLRFKM